MRYYDKPMGLNDIIENIRDRIEHLEDVKDEILHDLTKIKNELNSLVDCEDSNELFNKVDSIIVDVENLMEMIEE